MIRLADRTLGLRQVLASGRVADAVTGRGLDGFDITLRFTHGGGSGELPGALALKPDGWFAVQLRPAAQMPDLATVGPVTLTVRVTVPGRPPVEARQVVDGSELALVERSVRVSDTETVVEYVAGAPFTFSITLPPQPVALAGMVVRDHDPDVPVAGVELRADDGPPVVTDARGRFFLPALPVAESVTLALIEGEDQSVITYRPDFSRPVNTVTLSRPT